MTFILIASIIAVAIKIPIFFCQGASSVPGVSKFAWSAVFAVVGIAGITSSPVTPAIVHTVIAHTFLISACLLLLSGFQQFFGRPTLNPMLFVGLLGLFIALLAALTLADDNMVGRTALGAGSTSIIFGCLAATLARAWMRREAAPAFIAFALFSALGVSLLNLVRVYTVATGLDELSHFTDPTPWNVAFSSVRVLSLPVVYLSAILLTQDRIIANLEHHLTYGDLTGALSRRSFLDYCEQCFKRHVKQPTDISLLFMDLDRFKLLNDRFGHAVGDRALKHFVDVVSAVLPSQARFGRLGGEEFAVLLPATSMAEAISVAETMMRTIRQAPLNDDGHVISMTVSIGIAMAQPGETLDGVMNRADLALYQAKGAGRDRLHVRDDENPIVSLNGPPAAHDRRAHRAGKFGSVPKLVEMTGWLSEDSVASTRMDGSPEFPQNNKIATS